MLVTISDSTPDHSGPKSQAALRIIRSLQAEDYSCSIPVDEPGEGSDETLRELSLLAQKLQRDQQLYLETSASLKQKDALIESARQDLARSEEMTNRSREELNQFTYVTSHDLQAPLRAVAGFASFLQEEYQEQLDDTAREYIDHITRGVTRMQQQIKALVSYSRVESRGAAFELVDLNELLDDVLILHGQSIEDAEGTLTREKLPTVSGDRSQLFQHFQSLLDDSVKYRSQRPLEINISAKKSEGCWTIAFSDNGIGIAEKDHERIFQIFCRLHTEAEYPGTGIGLPICRRIVNRHGGKLWVESELGTGSTFYFTMPEAS
jgi:light-regulated signal transduction histidine kinase (bacteriophytochrome)